ncbi:hypothetical protein JCM6882_009739 [Rhodosporidiobolus microsporus]
MNKRCAPRAEAGVHLYFCSREHQKLVYSLHKNFCGRNAKPFHFPGLSPAEALEAVKVENFGLKTYTCRLDGTGELESREASLEERQKHLRDLVEDTPSSVPMNRATLLCSARSAIFEHLVANLPRSNSDGAKRPLPFLQRASDPLLGLSWTVTEGMRACVSTGFSPSCDKDWLLPFLHQAAICCALARACVNTAAAFDKAAYDEVETLLMPAIVRLQATSCGVEAHQGGMGQAMFAAVKVYMSALCLPWPKEI